MSAKEYRAGGVRVPSEHEECVWLMQWAKATRWRERPIAEILIHVPNGAYHGANREAGAVVAEKLRQEGLQPGVSDYLVPVPTWSRACPGLWLEMKRTKGGRESDDQKKFRARMRGFGWRCEVCLGWVEASRIIQEYLRGAHHESVDR